MDRFDELVAAGKTAAEIAAEMGVSRQAIYARAGRRGIKFPRKTRRQERDRPLQPKHTSRVAGVKISSQTAGAWAELLACAYLLSHGVETFRSVSPNCSVDAIGRIGGECYTIEVRSGTKQKNGAISYSAPKRLYDVLALVLLDGTVILRGPRSAELIDKMHVDKQSPVV